MKTLLVRNRGRLEIRAIATEAADVGGRDSCPTLQFVGEQARGWPSEWVKMAAVLDESSENGLRQPPDYDRFKKLKGTDLYEFKSPQGLRLLCFWDGHLIICTHGYVKGKQKAPKTELERGQRMMRDYFEAKRTGTLTHAAAQRTAI